MREKKCPVIPKRGQTMLGEAGEALSTTTLFCFFLNPGIVVCICELRIKEAEVGESLAVSGQPARPALEASGQMRDFASQNKQTASNGTRGCPQGHTRVCTHLCTQGHSIHTHKEVYDLTAMYRPHWLKSRVLTELCSLLAPRSVCFQLWLLSPAHFPFPSLVGPTLLVSLLAVSGANLSLASPHSLL